MAELQMRIGMRMKQAAGRAGLSWREIIAALGISQGTLYRWWSGQRRPSDEALERYASLVGVDRSYFYMLEGEVEQQVFKSLVQVADGLMRGETVTAALDQAIEAKLGTPIERAQLASASEAIRAALQEQARADWDQLSPDEKLEVIRYVFDRALARRRSGAVQSTPPRG